MSLFKFPILKHAPYFLRSSFTFLSMGHENRNEETLYFQNFPDTTIF